MVNKSTVRVPQITLFRNFFTKNGSYSTIYTFKNYFVTVFSVSVFNFSKNKLNPNRPYIVKNRQVLAGFLEVENSLSFPSLFWCGV